MFDTIDRFDTFQNIFNRVIERIFTASIASRLMSHILQCGNFFYNFFLSKFLRAICWFSYDTDSTHSRLRNSWKDTEGQTERFCFRRILSWSPLPDHTSSESSQEWGQARRTEASLWVSPLHSFAFARIWSISATFSLFASAYARVSLISSSEINSSAF